MILLLLYITAGTSQQTLNTTLTNARQRRQSQIELGNVDFVFYFAYSTESEAEILATAVLQDLATHPGNLNIGATVTVKLDHHGSPTLSTGSIPVDPPRTLVTVQYAEGHFDKAEEIENLLVTGSIKTNYQGSLHVADTTRK